jgi:hypothetical protein
VCHDWHKTEKYPGHDTKADRESDGLMENQFEWDQVEIVLRREENNENNDNILAIDRKKL